MIIVFVCGGRGDSGSGGGGVCVCACIRVSTRVHHLWACFACVCACVFVSDVSDTFSIHSGLAYEVSDRFLGYKMAATQVVFS